MVDHPKPLLVTAVGCKQQITDPPPATKTDYNEL